MAVYATYSQYTTDYLGTAIASADFAALALRASAYIDQLTYQRAAAIVLAGTETANIALIMMATCAVAEQLQTINTSGSSGGGGIKSESIGNYSVTYADGTFATFSTTAKLSQLAKLYLGSTGLMYAGFASGEYGGVFDED
jgi:hypothetical protein